jgi:hypothetical protein
MKPRKNIALIMILGLLLCAFAVAVAQTPAQGDQKKKTESAEEACCKSDSCTHHSKEAGTDAADAAAKSDEKHDCCKMKSKEKTDAAEQDCCGESCDMKEKHDANMKHDATMKHDAKGHKGGDCCNIKNRDAAKPKTKKAA